MSDYIIKDREFRLFRDMIYRLTGISLSDAKRQLVQARLQKRLRHYGFETYRQYYDLVVEQGDHGEEIASLINCITTNKTDFFREPHHFEFIQNELLPEMIREAAAGRASRRLRVWHAGCSTGEEPYTMAIVLSEALRAAGTWDVRLLASDIDTNVLSHAEHGVYEADRVGPIPGTLLRRYFLRGKGDKSDLYKVQPSLQEMIAFRQINLRSDPWPINPNVRFDIIFCRNVVIYFDKETQRRLFARFAGFLRPGGFLFIGHSESLLGISDAFTPVGGTIFQLADAGAEAAA